MASFSKREQDTYASAGSVAEEVLSCIRTVTSFNGQKQDIHRYVMCWGQWRRFNGIENVWSFSWAILEYTPLLFLNF